MTDGYADQRTGSRIRHYMQIGARRARLREMFKLSAAVCQHKLGVDEACKQHGLKLDDVLRYLAACGFLRSPTAATTEPQATTEPEAISDVGARLDEMV